MSWLIPGGSKPRCRACREHPNTCAASASLWPVGLLTKRRTLFKTVRHRNHQLADRRGRCRVPLEPRRHERHQSTPSESISPPSATPNSLPGSVMMAEKSHAMCRLRGHGPLPAKSLWNPSRSSGNPHRRCQTLRGRTEPQPTRVAPHDPQVRPVPPRQVHPNSGRMPIAERRRTIHSRAMNCLPQRRKARRTRKAIALFTMRLQLT